MTRDELHGVAVRAVCGQRDCDYPRCVCATVPLDAGVLAATIAVDAIIALALARLQGDGKPSALSGGGHELQASRGAISWRSGATSS